MKPCHIVSCPFLEDISQAQHDMDDRIKLNIEWIEEENDSDSCYLDNMAKQLAQREEVKVVIGPRFTSHADIVNYAQFDNLYRSYPQEFFLQQSVSSP